MASSGQLPLDLGGKPAYAAVDFLVAASNREALSRIEHWIDWPFFALALSGPAGSGKSHLAHLFATNARGPLVVARDLAAVAVPDLAQSRAVVVEDADRGVDETALLHLYNLMREASRPLLLTGREPPSRWAIALPDLSSRIAALPLVTIGAPDDALLAALMVKLFSDRQLRIGQDVPAYILPRIERSFAAVRAAVDALDKAALAGQRPVTVPLARSVLGLAPPLDPPGG